MNCAHCRRLLDAWLDSEVDDATAKAIGAHFLACPECASLRREREALRLLVRVAKDSNEVPVDVVRRVRQALDREHATPPVRLDARGFTWTQALAMCGVSAALAGMLVFALLYPFDAREASLEPVVDRHVAALSAGAPGAPSLQFASSERHQLKPWFQGRVPLSPPVVDLSAQGFELLGGRVERLGTREAAVVTYRIRKHPIDVFAWRDDGPDAPPHSTAVRGFSVVRWNAGGLALAAVSDLNASELQRFSAVLAR